MKKNITTQGGRGGRATPWQRLSRRARAGTLGLAGLASAGTVIGGCERSVDPEQQGPSQVSALFAGIPQQGAALGDPTAPITLTEISDLRCSHCRNFALDALPVLVERYVRPGRVRIVLRNWPILGEPSERAARLAVAAGRQDRMWQFVDLFFLNGSEGRIDVGDASLRRVAAEVPGLDVDRAMADRDAPEVEAQLAETAQSAREHHVRGVPYFTIGRTGEPARELTFQRSSDPDTFVAAIEALLSSEPEAQ